MKTKQKRTIAKIQLSNGKFILLESSAYDYLVPASFIQMIRILDKDNLFPNDTKSILYIRETDQYIGNPEFDKNLVNV